MVKDIQLRVNIEDITKEGILKELAAKHLGIQMHEINAVKVLRKSIDARKSQIIINYKNSCLYKKSNHLNLQHILLTIKMFLQQKKSIL